LKTLVKVRKAPAAADRFAGIFAGIEGQTLTTNFAIPERGN
jgi:hypothetical protein